MGHLDRPTLEAFYALLEDVDLKEAFEEFIVPAKPHPNYSGRSDELNLASRLVRSKCTNTARAFTRGHTHSVPTRVEPKIRR